MGESHIDSDLVLETQFRCKGSRPYIAWIDDILGIIESKDLELLGTLPHDICVVDSPKDS